MSELATTMHEGLISELKKVALENSQNRSDRRRLQSKLIRRGHLSREAAEIIRRQDQTEIKADFQRQYPLRKEFIESDQFLDFAEGKISADQIVREFLIVFRDVPTFIGWTYDTRDTDNKTTAWLRATGADLTKNIEAMRSQLNDQFGDVKYSSETRKQIWTLIETRLEEFRVKFFHQFLSEPSETRDGKHLSDSELQSLANSKMGSLPTIDTFIRGFFEHFRRSTLMDRSLKVSDAGDLFHLMHLPYVDIFRADGDFSQTVQSITNRYDVTVVSKLRDLPAAIDHRLSLSA